MALSQLILESCGAVRSVEINLNLALSGNGIKVNNGIKFSFGLFDSIFDSNSLKLLVEQLKMNWKKKKGDFFLLLDILGASLLGNLLTGKAIIRSGDSRFRAAQDF